MRRFEEGERGEKRDKEGAQEQSREDAIKSLGHRWQCQASLWLIHRHSAQELFSSLCDCVCRAQCVALFVNLLSPNHTAARGRQCVCICSVLRCAGIYSIRAYVRNPGDLNAQVLFSILKPKCLNIQVKHFHFHSNQIKALRNERHGGQYFQNDQKLFKEESFISK